VKKCLFFNTSGSEMAKQLYENAVYWQVRWLWERTWSGWAVLRAIEDAAKEKGTKVRIVPFTAEEHKARPSTLAYASFAGKGGAPKGVKPFKGESDDPKTKEDERYRLMDYTGTGEGDDSTVQYNPLEFDKDLECSATLIHELVHSLRQMRGLWNQVPTEPALKNYENEEEFFAAVVENIYRSEKGSTYLLYGHESTTEMNETQKTSVGFLTDGFFGVPNRRLVNKFVNSVTDLCSNIRDHLDLGIKFNPIREFMYNKGKYPLN
jgi:hypothetical protein